MNLQAAVLISVMAVQWASAQDPWTEFLKPRPGSGAPRWRLVLDPLAKETLFPTPPAFFARMMVAEELQIQAPNPEAVVRLWAAKNYSPELHWLLISPEGEVLPGPGPNPHPDRVLELLRSRGFVPRWERREAFLKEHPDQGEVRLEALKDSTLVAALQARTQMEKPGPPPPEGPFFPFPDTEVGRAKADAISRLYEADLEAFLKLPDPDRAPYSQLRIVMGNLVMAGWHQAPRMEALRTRLIEQCLRCMIKGGESSLMPFALQQGGPQAERALLEHLQQQPFLPPILHPGSNILRSLLQKQSFLTPSELLEALRRLDLGGFSPGMEDGAQIALHHTRQMSLMLQLRSLIQLERWDEAANVLIQLRPFLSVPGKPERETEILKRECGETGLKHPELKAILDSPAPPPPANPIDRLPLRLCLLGPSPWQQDWQALKSAPNFSLWGVDELRWEEMAPPVAEALRKQQGWTSGPRWVLLRGKTVLAHDNRCPTPAGLADRLSQIAPSSIQGLNTILQRYPENMPAHRRRLELILRFRMPNPRLEPLMAEDMLALEDFDPAITWTIEGWQPNPEIWETYAVRALPRIEAALTRWPSRTKLWETWVFWAQWHPRHPSVVSLLNQVPFWSKRGSWSLSLPKAVHLAIAQDYRKTRRYEEMRSWFQTTWSTLDRRPLHEIEDWAREFHSSHFSEWEESIVNPLREALKALGRDAELQSLDRTWAMMQGKEKAK